MPRLNSGVLVAVYNQYNELVWSKDFTTKWESNAPCEATHAGFFREKAQSLASTQFPVREEHISMLNKMQSALLCAAKLSQDAEFPTRSVVFDTVQMTQNMACDIVQDARHSDANSHIETYFGPLSVTYHVGGVTRSLRTDAPALCCHFTSDRQHIVLNSYTRPERKAETPLSAGALQCEAVFSQHFIATQDANYRQAPVRRVLAGRDINRSLPCHARFLSHRDARSLAKAEHEAVRRACGFSDAAWARSEISCTPKFSVWATPHADADVHVASVFLH